MITCRTSYQKSFCFLTKVKTSIRCSIHPVGCRVVGSEKTTLLQYKYRLGLDWLSYTRRIACLHAWREIMLWPIVIGELFRDTEFHASYILITRLNFYSKSALCFSFFCSRHVRFGIGRLNMASVAAVGEAGLSHPFWCPHPQCGAAKQCDMADGLLHLVARIAYVCSDTVLSVQPALKHDSEFSQTLHSLASQQTPGVVAKSVEV